VTESNTGQLQELMRKFGYTEKEARISVLLDEAEDLFAELIQGDPGSDLGKIVWTETHVRERFNDLHRRLALRVLRRDYPEGWGHMPSEDEEE